LVFTQYIRMHRIVEQIVYGHNNRNTDKLVSSKTRRMLTLQYIRGIYE